MYPPTRPEHEASRVQSSEAMRVWMLGGFEVFIGSRTVGGDAWRLKKASTLVKLLALAPGHRLHREQVIDLLWPDSGRKAASNNLRKTLHAARKTLGANTGSRYLVSEGESLVLCPKGELWVDIDAFEEAAGNARRARDPAAYRAAIELYTGDLLPEDRYEEWAVGRREELRRLHLNLLVELAGVYERRGDLEWAIEALQMAVAREPTIEEAHAGMMRLYPRLDREGEALAQYERLREALSRQLGTQPSTATRRLYEDIYTGRSSTTHTEHIGPSKEQNDPDAGRHNLPAARDSFVGRERELIEIKRALSMTRLLTLTGVGGSGKTRLALEVTRDLVGAYPDGVWLVELAPLTDGDLVPQAVADALGVEERPGQPLARTLAEVLRPKTTLLVLDNCEHLVDASAQLVDDLLSSCPRLRVLATSREALDVAGEVKWPVPPLPVPASGYPPTVEELEGYESARLFVERASNRYPGFAITTETARHVAQICRRLDGIPLAIELAAARVGTLAVEQIYEMLEDSLGFLTGGGRTAVPRQGTLRGALDWSHELLSEPERIFFRRLSVFAGGWTLEAAEDVGAPADVGKGDSLELLSRLVDKSLVLAEVTRDGTPRYRMLEPIRQYSRDKLEESSEVEEVSRQHTEFFLSLVEEAEPHLWGTEQATWLTSLEAEYDNFGAALSWVLGQADADLALRLGGALRWFWHMRGHYRKERKWLEQALTKDSWTSAAARAKALDAIGWTAFGQGDMDRGKIAAEEGLKLSAETGIQAVVVVSLRNLLGEIARVHGDLERARALYEESLAFSRKSGDERAITWALAGAAMVSSDQADYQRATELYEEGIALAQALGYPAQLAYFWMNLGWEYLYQGNYEQATEFFEQAATLVREREYRTGLQHALAGLGWATLLRGDHKQAKALYEESLKLQRELGSMTSAAENLEGLGCIAGIRGEVRRMAKLFGAARQLNEGVGYQYLPREIAIQEPYLANGRSQVGEAAWEGAFAEGREMTLEAAIEYALSEEETSPATSPTLSQQPPHILTRREEEVATLVAQGLTNRQIGTELHVSEHTAATHVRRLLKKLGLRSRTQVGSWLIGQPPTADPN